MSEDGGEVPVKPKDRTMTRRNFLRLGRDALIGGAVVSMIGPGKNVEAQEDREVITREVPPSIMLHSRWNHEQILPGLIDELRNRGYEGVTYKDFLASFEDDSVLPEKPVIISIDDLSMARGVPAYTAFSRMRATCAEKDFPVVFAVNTNPDQDQDDSRWDEVRGWVDEGGVELATHTGMHTNLNNWQLGIDDIRSEVADSARTIEERTGQRVDTLILPFGAGYDMNTGEIRAEIVQVCQEAGIKFVVGIAGGREPVQIDGTEDNPVYLMGRVGPGAVAGEETIDTAMWEVNHW